MADNYCDSSSFLNVPPGKLDKAREIIARVEEELETGDEGYVGCQSQVLNDEERCGIWFSGDESCNVEHVELIARALVDELELEGDFICSWAYTCSKPRIDEFGGGAFVIRRGVETLWCDARSEVEDKIRRMTK